MNSERKFRKPNWYPKDDINANKSGWIYLKNHGEVLYSYGHLDKKLGEAGYDPETGEKINGPKLIELPVIEGEFKTQRTITVTDGEWEADYEITFSYDWEESVDGSDWISTSETLNEFNLTSSSLGKFYRVKVTLSYTIADIPGEVITYTLPTDQIVTSAVIPEFTVLPSITGNAMVNQTLTANLGTWTGTEVINVSSMWEMSINNGEWIEAGISDTTYLLKYADIGKRYRLTVRLANEAGEITSTSTATGQVVTDIIAPANTVLPTITGTLKAGSTITANRGTWTGTNPEFEIEWEKSTNSGPWTFLKIGANHVLTESDNGVRFRINVTASNTSGESTATSNIVGPSVTGHILPAATVQPKITGTTREGSTLTGDKGTWSGTTPTIVGKFQMSNASNWVDIKTGDTLLLDSTHVGKSIRYFVTATNNAGSVNANTTGTSNITALPVTPANTSLPTVNTAGFPLIKITNGTWQNDPTSYSVSWKQKINGGAEQTVVLTKVNDTDYTYIADHNANTTISVSVTATNEAGSATASSTFVTIANVVPTVKTNPVISGTIIPGNTINTTNGTWSGTIAMTYEYDWEISNDNISWNPIIDQENNSLILLEDYSTKYVRSKVTAINAAGRTEAVSNSLGPIEEIEPEAPKVLPVNTSLPSMIDDGSLGFTYVPGVWTDADSVTFDWYISDGGSYNGVRYDSNETTVNLSDKSGYVYIVETATNADGSASVNSQALQIILAP